MKSKVSIIVPIYKVEKYLEKCVDSLTNQTYKNIEIILVDDGSPDNCPLLCDDFSKLDDRIVVVHKKNGGLSSARNAGLDVCTGDYIMFIDSDDYIANNMVESLLDFNKSINADLVICDYYLVYDSKLKSQNHFKRKKVVTENSKFEMLYQSKYAIPTLVAWNKLYRRELFNNLRYDEGKLHEDEFIICKILKNAKKIAYLPEKLYYYVQRDGSIMSKFSLKSFDKIEAFDLRISFFRDNSVDNLIGEAQYQKLLACISCLNGYSHSDYEIDSSIIKKTEFEIDNLLTQLIISNSLKLKRKLKVLIYYYFPKLYRNWR